MKKAKTKCDLYALSYLLNEEQEVTSSVIDGPQSVVWDEAENQTYILKKLLLAFANSRLTYIRADSNSCSIDGLFKNIEKT